MNAIVPFQFGDRPIKVINEADGPRFILHEICKVLDIESAADAARRLDDDEKGTVITDTLGGPQRVTTINESGLWSLILRSRKPEAKQFKKWVTAEVLPAIRTTGHYGRSVPAIDLTDNATLHRLLLETTGKGMELEHKIEELRPKAAALDRIADASGAMPISDAAKQLGISPGKIFPWLERMGWIFKRSGSDTWLAAQPKLDALYFKHITFNQQREGRPDAARRRAWLTPKGLAKLAEIIEREGTPT